jgi:hypothetical protein
MNANMPDTLTDPAEIRRALDLLVEPGGVVELRAWGCLPRFREGILSGYFNDIDKVSASAALLSRGGVLPLAGRSEKIDGAEGVYLVLNPIDRGLVARASNKLRRAKGGDTTSDQYVIGRRWLFIDCDPARPSGISSTDAEKLLAEKKAKEIGRTLREEFEFPDPVLADSGNGWHLLYRIDLPSDDGARQTIEAFLKALAARFDSPGVHVDQKVFNAARICKLYGTAARKGDSIDERPHRTSRLVHVPDAVHVVDSALLGAVIAEWLPVEPTPARAAAPSRAGELGPFPMDEFIGRHGLDASGPKPYRGGEKWQLTCPFNPDHKKPDAALYLTSDGKPGFTCSHSSCQGRDMKALVAHLGDSEVSARFEPRRDHFVNSGNNALKNNNRR